MRCTWVHLVTCDDIIGCYFIIRRTCFTDETYLSSLCPFTSTSSLHLHIHLYFASYLCSCSAHIRLNTHTHTHICIVFIGPPLKKRINSRTEHVFSRNTPNWVPNLITQKNFFPSPAITYRNEYLPYHQTIYKSTGSRENHSWFSGFIPSYIYFLYPYLICHTFVNCIIYITTFWH